MTEPDAWLLVEYREGFINPARVGHLTCATIEDDYFNDYFNPVIICKTRQELVDFLGTEHVAWNGDTATVEKYSWQGELKYSTILYAIPVQFGKLIVY